MSHHHTPEVMMNRPPRPFARLALLATTVLGILLVTAGQAAAMYPPDPGGGGRVYEAPSPAQIQPVTDNSVSVQQWVLFTAAVLGALAIGAALMHLTQRRRAQLAR